MPNLNHTARIIEILTERPWMSRAAIAEEVGCSVGRVGEVVRGGGTAYQAGNRRTRRAAAARGPLDRSNRTFGVELEVSVPSTQEAVSALVAAGVNVQATGYTHQTTAYWKVTTDASIRPNRGQQAVEIVSPVLKGQAGRDELATVLRVLNEIGTTVNVSMGTHTHHGAEGLTANGFGRLAGLWFSQQRTIDNFVAPSRRGPQQIAAGQTYGNAYCLPLQQREVLAVQALRTVQRRMSMPGVGRFRSLNFNSYGRHGTIEIRQHQGTTSFAKLGAWVDFGQAMLAWAEGNAAIPTEGLTVDELLTTLVRDHGMPVESAQYMASRAASFMSDSLAGIAA